MRMRERSTAHAQTQKGCFRGYDTAVRNCEKSVRNHGNLRNQGLENLVEEIWKSAREIKRETPLLCLSMRSRPFAHAHLRNP